MTTTDIKQHYRQLLETYGDTFESAQYSSRESQEARFDVLSSVGDLDHAKVLDFGCGTGHFATYLKASGIQCDYTGVDILEDFFPIAREKHPEARFAKYEEVCSEIFDYIFVSGVFNNKLDNNLVFFEETVKKLHAICDKALAFNAMSTYVDYQDEGLWYVEPEYVFKFVKKLTPFVLFRNDYVVKDTSVPFEFTVFAYQNPNKT